MAWKWNRWPWVESRASYTDLAVLHLASRAAGILPAANATAIAEACAGLWARSLAGATVEGTDSLTPAVLAMMGRALFHRGEFAAAIRTNGGLRLEPCASWDIEGEGALEDRWTYRLDIAGPSSTRTERISGPGVLHVRYAAETETPWAGQSPLALAGVSAEVLAQVEAVWKCELGGAFGYVLPLPRAGADDTTLAEIRQAIGAAKGGLVTVETTQGGWGAGRIDAPQAEYAPKRFGGSPPSELREIRGALVPAIMSAAGVGPELLRVSDGSGMRESYRRFVLTTMQPIGNLIAAEASAKLERDVSLSFERLRGADVQGIGRALKSLVDSGMALPDALEAVGLD